MTENSLTIENADRVVDVTGQVCAMPILSAADSLRDAADGDLLAIKTGRPADECDDIEDWVARLNGASFIGTRSSDAGVIAFARRDISD
ncbi:Sulfurtransferase TusA [Halogranum amylolyticum]|uniref:Sulfurtransferase TusA n=1 Tax=Halogranum amylolyticum TaxID=660520 RepID=A0A1H8V4Q7_9EURY|nr:Sulfurtransferase TusA [Halogranum amylolyticum]